MAYEGFGLLGKLIKSGECVLYHDYRSKSLADHSQFSNDGTPTNITWADGGVRFPLTDSKITVSDSPELRLTEGSIFIYGEFHVHENAARFVSKRDAGGINYEYLAALYLGFIPVYAVGAVTLVGIPGNTEGTRSFAVNFRSTEQCEYFVDGLLLGIATGAQTFVTNTAPVYIGNGYDDAYNVYGMLRSTLIFNRKLTHTEHAQIHDELFRIKW
jgi:hypothetical protein